VLFYADFANLASRSLTGDNNSKIDDSLIISPLILAPFIMPFIGNMKTYLKFNVLLANMLLLFFGVLTATRSYILITIIALISLVNFKKLIGFKPIGYVFLFFIFFLFFVDTEFYKNSILAEQLSFVQNRFNIEGDISNGRISEVDGLFLDFNYVEIILGRGAGAEQKFGFWEEISGSQEHGINFTHFGFLNLILKGGVLLLFIIYGMAFYSLLIFIKYGEKKYFFVTLIYLVAELSHTLFINYFTVLFLWLAISLAIQLAISKKKYYE
jgi:hypothetical protein